MELRDFFEGTTYEDVKIGGIMSTEKHQNELSTAYGYYEVSMYLLDELKNAKETRNKKGDHWIYPIFSCVNSMIRYYLASILYQLDMNTGVKKPEEDKCLSVEDMFDTVLEKSKSKLKKAENDFIVETLEPLKEYFKLMKDHDQALGETPKINSKEEYFVNVEQYQKWVDEINSRLEGCLGQLNQLNEVAEYI